VQVFGQWHSNAPVVLHCAYYPEQQLHPEDLNLHPSLVRLYQLLHQILGLKSITTGSHYFQNKI
jgi:hypothetical protein